MQLQLQAQMMMHHLMPATKKTLVKIAKLVVILSVDLKQPPSLIVTVIIIVVFRSSTTFECAHECPDDDDDCYECNDDQFCYKTATESYCTYCRISETTVCSEIPTDNSEAYDNCEGRCERRYFTG